MVSLQEEADRLDTMLNTLSLAGEGGAAARPHSLYLGTWLLYHVLKLMVGATTMLRCNLLTCALGHSVGAVRLVRVRVGALQPA